MSHEIRAGFLEYFRRKDHKIIEGSSVVPKNDPSLLFINAGMAPLKPYFLGLKTPDCKRMANVQPCIRTNDIADVGDRHHLTMFEMLGSWSIGDYFKERAVELAFELLVDVLGFPKDRLYASVYAGNQELNLSPDETSYQAWQKVGIPSERIVMLSEDNFWAAGDTGPCGPCTEVFFDTGEEFGEAYQPGQEFDTTKRYIEIWNAGVFMEFDRKPDGSYEPLPFKSVDTGSGLERMTMVMNGVSSVYETDLFAPLMKLGKGLFPGLSEPEYRVMSDHMRASSFIMSAGILPSNEGQGYIPRRLLRKCMAYAYLSGEPMTELLGMYQEIIKLLGEAYPDLSRSQVPVSHGLQTEMREFEPILKSGIKMFEQKIAQIKNDEIKGELVFDLVATHGLPLEIIQSLARAKSLSVDLAGYEAAFKKHQDTSRVISATKFHGLAEDSLALTAKEMGESQFLGYERSEEASKIVGLLKEGQKVDKLLAGERGFVVVEKTPFYAESGGQVGETGEISTKLGRARVEDTQKQEETFFHAVLVLEGQLSLQEPCQLSVASEHRQQSAANHSATHLLHAALRKVLGEHVIQKGSLVAPDKLRFDFQHPKAVTSEELEAIEELVNQWIWASYKNETEVLDYEAAMAKGAMALFDETYGDRVRVVRFGEPSIELCGGIHVRHTGEIGLFTIVSEGSVAKGVRRIEALTQSKALEFLLERKRWTKATAEALQVKPYEIIDAIASLKKQLRAAQKAKSEVQPKEVKVAKKGVISGLPYGIIGFEGALDRSVLTDLAKKVMGQEGLQVLIALMAGPKKGALVIVSEEGQKVVAAPSLLNKLLKPYGGRGGGKPGLAQGGFETEASLEDLIQGTEKELES